jgi:hypothetical protein
MSGTEVYLFVPNFRDDYQLAAMPAWTSLEPTTDG